MPVVTMTTLWPLHLAFFFARPSLERLADQVSVGKLVRIPERAGLFTVNGSAVDTATGSVALMIDPNPNGPTGFVRQTGPKHGGPILGTALYVELGFGWSYNEED